MCLGQAALSEGSLTSKEPCQQAILLEGPMQNPPARCWDLVEKMLVPLANRNYQDLSVSGTLPCADA